MKTIKSKISAITFFMMLMTMSGQKTNEGVQNSNPLGPIGEMVDMGGYKLHFNVEGNSNTTLIIEAGAGSWTLQWLKFQKELAKHFKVVTYDRAGYGWSDASPYSRTASNIAEELHNGLKALGIDGPHILFGHSYGGLIIKAFTNKYPDEVKALVLADAATEYQFERLPEMVSMILNSGKERFKTTGTMARAGKIMKETMPTDSILSPKYWDAYKASLTRASFYDAMFNEMDLLPTTYLQSQILGRLEKPVLVITAQNSFGAFQGVPNLPIEQSDEAWHELQKAQLKISSNSRQHIIEGATHDLTKTAPTELANVTIEFIKTLN